VSAPENIYTRPTSDRHQDWLRELDDRDNQDEDEGGEE
jgi:hypothetical protein